MTEIELLSNFDTALQSGDRNKVLTALLSPSLALTEVNSKNVMFYVRVLNNKKGERIEETKNSDYCLNAEEIQDCVDLANIYNGEGISANHIMRSSVDLARDELAVMYKQPKITQELVSDGENYENMAYTDEEIDEMYKTESNNPSVAVVLAFSAAFQSGDHQTILDALLNPDFNLQNVQGNNINHYVKALQDQVEEKAKGSDAEEISFSAQDIQKCVDTGNEEAKRLLLAAGAALIIILKDAFNTGDRDKLSNALKQSREMGLHDVNEDNMKHYMEVFTEKAEEHEQDGSDITAEYIQDCINAGNRRAERFLKEDLIALIKTLTEAVQNEDLLEIKNALQNPEFELEEIKEDHMKHYMNIINKRSEHSPEGAVSLSKADIQDCINSGNRLAESLSNKVPTWVLAFNEIFKNGDQNEIKQAISDCSNGLKNVDLKNIMLYFAALEDRRNSLLENDENGLDGLLTEEDVQTCIDSANEKAAQSEVSEPPGVKLFNEVFRNGNKQMILKSLLDPDLKLNGVTSQNISYYLTALEDMKNDKVNETGDDDPSLTTDEIQECVELGNMKAKQAVERRGSTFNYIHAPSSEEITTMRAALGKKFSVQYYDDIMSKTDEELAAMYSALGKKYSIQYEDLMAKTDEEIAAMYAAMAEKSGRSGSKGYVSSTVRTMEDISTKYSTKQKFIPIKRTLVEVTEENEDAD